MNAPLRVVILVFDDVEVLDFCGPFEVFSVANRDVEPQLFDISVVALSEKIVARGGLSVNPHHSLESCPQADILLIPGGIGVTPQIEDEAVVNWVISQASTAQLVTSVCTGAVLLGRAGLLDDLDATTHHRCIEQLQRVAPRTRVVTNKRFVDEGRFITSAGISAGIDMALHIVCRLAGIKIARDVAARMEYDWNNESTNDE